MVPDPLYCFLLEYVSKTNIAVPTRDGEMICSGVGLFSVVVLNTQRNLWETPTISSGKFSILFL